MIKTQNFPSSYGEWTVSAGEPPIDLANYVDGFWESKGHVAFGFERLVPRGLVDLIFNLSGPQAMYADQHKNHPRVYNRSWVSGLFNRPLYVGPAYDAGIMGTHLVGVSISPWAVYSLFGIEAHELYNTVIEASDLFGQDVNCVWQQIGDAPSPDMRYAIAMDFIRACQSKLARPAPFSAIWAAQKTQQHIGNIRVQDLCDELEISRKHLGTLFKRTLGMSPKAYARLSRFRASMMKLQINSDEPLAGLAHDLGFSDQAHFINEFSAYAGASPARFLRDVSADGESVLFEQDR